MSTQHERETFDETEREGIRRALRGYMSDHRIGVPTLNERIEKADAPLHREMPLSTLQRFLRGKHRTSDFYVEMCAAFLRKMDLPIAPHAFGVSLASFYSVPTGEAAEPMAMSIDGLAGNYRVYLMAAQTESPLPVRPQSKTPSSWMTLSGLPGRGFLIAEEDIRVDPSDPKNKRRLAYEGVALWRGDTLYAMLRSALTRHPRTYSLRPRQHDPRVEKFILEGEGFEHPVALDRHSHCKAQFITHFEMVSPS